MATQYEVLPEPEMAQETLSPVAHSIASLGKALTDLQQRLKDLARKLQPVRLSTPRTEQKDVKAAPEPACDIVADLRNLQDRIFHLTLDVEVLIAEIEL